MSPAVPASQNHDLLTAPVNTIVKACLGPSQHRHTHPLIDRLPIPFPLLTCVDMEPRLSPSSALRGGREREWERRRRRIPLNQQPSGQGFLGIGCTLGARTTMKAWALWCFLNSQSLRIRNNPNARWATVLGVTLTS